VSRSVKRARPEVESYECFIHLFHSVIGHPVQGREVDERLLRLLQGSRTASKFALEFRNIAAYTRWNKSALDTVFSSGLR
jgi:hypothetical protein